MTDDPATRPETTAVAPAASGATDEFDPLGWEVPVICKDCAQGFTLPYRHFQAGVVFHCPHCRGSFVPTVPMHRAVREAFETFYAERQRAQEECRQSGGDETALRSRQMHQLDDFRRILQQLAQAMRPAGKLVRRKGIRAMFT